MSEVEEEDDSLDWEKFERESTGCLYVLLDTRMATHKKTPQCVKLSALFVYVNEQTPCRVDNVH